MLGPRIQHTTLMAEEKTAVRTRVRAVRRALSAEERASASEAIARRAFALPELDEVRAVLVYGASLEEADPAPLECVLRERGVLIAYPRVVGPRALALHWIDDPGDLVSGAFGLREPAPEAPQAALAELDLVIVPGVAFDAWCNRLGYGGGFYDTLLADLPHTLPTVGLAFEEQIVDRVPCEPFDRPLDIVVTPVRTLRRCG